MLGFLSATDLFSLKSVAKNASFTAATVQAIERVKVITYDGCRDLYSVASRVIAKNCPRLEKLRVFFWGLDTRDCIYSLLVSKSTQLTSLQLKYKVFMRVIENALISLPALTSLEIFEDARYEHFKDRYGSDLGKLHEKYPGLKHLRFSAPANPAKYLESISRLKKLESLKMHISWEVDFPKTRIKFPGLKSLKLAEDLGVRTGNMARLASMCGQLKNLSLFLTHETMRQDAVSVVKSNQKSLEKCALDGGLLRQLSKSCVVLEKVHTLDIVHHSVFGTDLMLIAKNRSEL
eukprot:TRINITY_DN492_c0_g1_i2.p1 TRINITY_DN492_c0_g1~~TRINITY_DN492_c0_g1_i2.p1  ORF type:complete len:291 (+),score=41.65 TRINITY_DN492_c0_g1_i2:297-1169(+)